MPQKHLEELLLLPLEFLIRSFWGGDWEYVFFNKFPEDPAASVAGVGTLFWKSLFQISLAVSHFSSGLDGLFFLFVFFSITSFIFNNLFATHVLSHVQM